MKRTAPLFEMNRASYFNENFLPILRNEIKIELR